MKIKMLTTACGPDGMLESGKVYDLPTAQAENFLAKGAGGRAHAVMAPANAAVSQIIRAPEVEKMNGAA